MDVILDSNAYLSDIRFEKASFQSLLEYLKRVGHHLVIPEVVYQEVLARHREILSAERARADAAWAKLGNWRILDHKALPKVNFDAESSALEKRLNQPSNWVKCIRYKEDPAIEAIDVALRGVNRTKPASTNGEQLRDVLVWLTVLQYAKKARQGVAFISHDSEAFEKDKNRQKTFGNPLDLKELHPDLQKDCENAGVRIHFYTNISDFIQQHALEQSPFAESMLPKELSFQSFDHKLAIHIANTKTIYGFASEFRLKELNFREGTLFKISKAVSVAELEYEGTVLLKFDLSQNRNVFVLAGLSGESFPETFWRQSIPADVTNAGQISTASAQLVERLFDIHTLISARFREGNLVAWEVESLNITELKTSES